MAYLAVLLSGAGGLIYQLAWTRWLASWRPSAIRSATSAGAATSAWSASTKGA